MIPSLERSVDQNSYLARASSDNYDTFGQAQDIMLLNIVRGDAASRLPQQMQPELRRLDAVANVVSASAKLEPFQKYLLETGMQLAYCIDYIDSQTPGGSDAFFKSYTEDYRRESKNSPVPLMGLKFLEDIMFEASSFRKLGSRYGLWSGADPMTQLILFAYEISSFMKSGMTIDSAISELRNRTQNSIVKSVSRGYARIQREEVPTTIDENGNAVSLQ